jgi:hypothetical protein
VPIEMDLSSPGGTTTSSATQKFPNILGRRKAHYYTVLCPSLHVRDQVLHPYRTAGNITVLYILILKLLGSRRERKIS